MVLSFVVPLNMLLEVLMITIQSIAYKYSYNRGMYARIDQIYLGFVIPFFFMSLSWYRYYRPPERLFAGWSRNVRVAEGAVLLLVGGLMIHSARLIQNSYTCNTWQEYTNGDDCQQFALKIAAGALAIVNGLLYFIPPCKFVQPQPAAPRPTVFIDSDGNGHVVDAPPSYFEVIQQQPAPQLPYSSQSGTARISTQQMQSGYYTPGQNPSEQPRHLEELKPPQYEP